MAKPDRKVQVNLRMSPDEREALVKAASARKTTFNGFVTWLIFTAMEQEVLLDARQVLEDAARTLAPLVVDAHVLQVNGDYCRAVGKLLTLLQPLVDSGRPVIGREREAIRDVIAEISGAERVLEIEAADRFRSMRTSGGAR